jgi:predicted dehydrogenase
MEFQFRNWWHFTWLSGDHIVEQAIHSIDRMAWAMGDALPTQVTCLGGRAARSGPEHGNVYDHFAAVYEYAGGQRCFHTCRQIDNCPSDNTDYIYGPRGMCTVNGWTPTYLAQDYKGKELWKYGGPTDRDMYQNEHDELFKSIRDGKPINDAERSCNSTMMAMMGRFAAYTGQTITWEQAMKSQENLMPGSIEFGPAETPPVAIPGKTRFV